MIFLWFFDDVVYICFVSVYCDFDSLECFIEEICGFKGYEDEVLKSDFVWFYSVLLGVNLLFVIVVGSCGFGRCLRLFGGFSNWFV